MKGEQKMNSNEDLIIKSKALKDIVNRECAVVEVIDGVEVYTLATFTMKTKIFDPGVKIGFKRGFLACAATVFCGRMLYKVYKKDNEE